MILRFSWFIILTKERSSVALLLLNGFFPVIKDAHEGSSVISTGSLLHYLQAILLEDFSCFTTCINLIFGVLRRIKSCLFCYLNDNIDEIWDWDLGALVPWNKRRHKWWKKYGEHMACNYHKISEQPPSELLRMPGREKVTRSTVNSTRKALSMSEYQLLVKMVAAGMCWFAPVEGLLSV